MNLPNRLTLMRVLLTPVFMLLLYLTFPGHMLAALGIFILASVTDFLDGYIARSRNLITDFGKFMDSLADKILVLAAMIWFVEVGKMPGWCLLIVVAREFAVSGLRMVAASNGRVIAAGWSGKVKTASTMVGICLVLLLNEASGVIGLTFLDAAIVHSAEVACVVVIMATTIYSGIEYFIKNKDVFKGQM